MAARPSTAPAGAARLTPSAGTRGDNGSETPLHEHNLRPFTAIRETDVMKSRGLPGHHWRFHYPLGAVPVANMGYFDVYCPWDGADANAAKGEAEIDACPWDPELRHIRLNFSRRPSAAHFGPGWDNPHEPEYIADARRRYVSGDEPVEVAAMAKWAQTLRPKSVQDLRPLTVLLQGVVKNVVDGPLKFYSAREERLQSELDKANEQISKQLAQLEVLTKQLQDAGHRADSEHAASLMQSGINALVKQRLREELELQRKRMEEEYQQKMEEAINETIRVERARADKLLATLKKDLADLKDKHRKYVEENGDALAKLSEAEDQLARANFELIDAKKLIEGLRDELNTEKDLLAEARRSETQANMYRDLAEETLRGTKFLPWGAYRPIVQRELNAIVVDGLYTMSLPPDSVGVAPAQERKSGYIFDLPGKSRVILDESRKLGDKTTELIAFPTNSKLFFNTGTAEVELPSGAWVVFSERNEQKLPRYCSVQQEKGNAPFDAPYDKNGCYLSQGDEKEALIIPPNSIVKMPDTQRAKLSIPSGSSVFIKVGDNRLCEVPLGTTIEFSGDEENNTVCVPAKTKMILPGGNHLMPIVASAKSEWVAAKFMDLPKASVTLPPRAILESPKDAMPTREVAPGETKVISSNIPKSTTVPAGCKITLPAKRGSNAPKIVAKRLRSIGPVGAAQAMILMDPDFAAQCLRELPPFFCARMLECTPPDYFYKIYQVMGGKIQMYAERMDEGCRYRLYAHKPSELYSRDLQISGAKMQPSVNALGDLETLASSIDHNPAGLFDIEALRTSVGPKCTSRIIMDGTAVSVANTLNHFAAMDRKSATHCMRELYEWIDQYADLSERSKTNDIYRANLLQWVASARSGRDLHSRIAELTELMSSQYNTRCTITKATLVAKKWADEGEVKLFSAKTHLKKNDTMAKREHQMQLERYANENPDGEGPAIMASSSSKKLEASASLHSSASMKSQQGQSDETELDHAAQLDQLTLGEIEYVEQRCEDEIEVVHTTENVFIGADSADRYLQSHALGETQTVLLLRASSIVAAQSKAYHMEDMETLWIPPFMIVPIFDDSSDSGRRTYGFITTMVEDYKTNYGSMDDQDVPEPPFPTRSAQCMTLAAEAVSLAVTAIETERHKAYQELLNGTMDKSKYDCEVVASVYHERAKVLAYSMMDDQLEICGDLAELKAYKHAPDAVIICITSVMLLVGNRQVLKLLNKRGATPRTAWPAVKQHVQVASEHPKFLLRQVLESTKMPTMECDIDDDLVAMAMSLLDTITAESAQRASRATEIIYRCATYLREMQIEIENAKKVIASDKIKKFSRSRGSFLHRAESFNAGGQEG